MKVTAVVPIKLNSVRLPQKNIRSFKNGQPLCCYILNTLLAVQKIDEVYVYCSNPKIKDYIPKEVKFLQRSPQLDLDTTKMNEVLKSFGEEVYADIYVMTHTTAPFVKKESIEKGLHAVLEQGYDSAFAVKRLQDFLWKDGRPYNYSLEDIPRTQDLEAVYEETSGFYIFERSVMTDYNRRIGKRQYMVEVSEIEAIDIDEEEDFIIADAIFNYLRILPDGERVTL